MGMFDRLTDRKTPARSPRLGTRVPIALRVNVRLARDGSVHSVLLEDLAAGGARISTPVRFARTDALSLIIETARNEKAEPVCRIVSIRPRRGELHIDYGLKFVALRAGEAEQLRTHVARQQSLRNTGKTAFSLARNK